MGAKVAQKWRWYGFQRILCMYFQALNRLFMPGEKSPFSDDLLNRLKFFAEDIDALRVSRNLRKVFFDYLKFQEGMSDKDFDIILTDVEAVFELLDAFAVEKNGRDKPAERSTEPL